MNRYTFVVGTQITKTFTFEAEGVSDLLTQIFNGEWHDIIAVALFRMARNEEYTKEIIY